MPVLEDDTAKTRKFLKRRLQTDAAFRGYEKEVQHIRDLLYRTAENGESNSALLLGPRGCGKTTLVTSVLIDLQKEKSFCSNTLIVYLNGFLHTDDRLALKSATSQMNLENVVDGKVFGSFAENLAFLLGCLKAGDKKNSKSVIFILEEFDLFCSHHNQTLLYNLFDVAQSAQAPICVLGITARLDVIELLEKRVKSRFSHRQIFLLPMEDNFAGRVQLFGTLLKLPTEKEMKEYNTATKLKSQQNHEIPLLRNVFDPNDFSFSSKWVSKWNKHLDALVSTPSVVSILQNMYEYEVLEGPFKSFLFELVSELSESSPLITVEQIQMLYQQCNNDDKVVLLCGLSVLEICLLIAMKHHSEIYDRDPFNFEMVLTRYNKFANSSSTMQGIERNVILKAFEHVKNLELIAPISSAASKVQKEYQLHHLLLTYGQINQAIQRSQNLPTEISQWAQRLMV
ncbi:origin recognition complex subunit 4 [Sabethes cyaneus]|uniref:origin recognition complex subunit 4 n=1 Tax=Sabethes cyaneus TaxID=53552 RepID=UPI00237ECF0A|nr:origin recognition complex subunit 4 [Sabethes cyaneus]